MREPPIISRVHVRSVIVPVDPVVETSAGPVRAAPLVLIDVETTTAVVGSAYLFCYTTLVLEPVTELVRQLGASLIGGPLAPRTAAAGFIERMRLLGTDGLIGMALAGLDMALWDALARSVDKPLATLLGGTVRPMRAYLSLRSSSPTAVAAETSAALKSGYAAVKVRVGNLIKSRDINVVEAAVDALRSAPSCSTSSHVKQRSCEATADVTVCESETSSEVGLMIDYNQALAPLGVAGAKRRIREIERIAGDRLVWIEEPLAADDNAGHAELARELDVPIQLGENWFGPKQVATGIAAGATDYVMLDVMKIGGVTGWLSAAAMAGASGKPISSHIFPEFSAHLLAVTAGGHWLEVLDLAAPIRAAPISVEKGAVRGFDSAGAGLAWNDDAVRTYAAPNYK